MVFLGDSVVSSDAFGPEIMAKERKIARYGSSDLENNRSVYLLYFMRQSIRQNVI